MIVQVNEEKYNEIAEGLCNFVITDEEWEPMKGLLFIECGEDQIIADILECIPTDGRWMIMFSPIGRAIPADGEATPIAKAMDEVPKIPKKQKGRWREVVHGLTKPWHGYYV